MSQVEDKTLQAADKNDTDINKEAEEKDVAQDAVDRNAHPLQFTYTLWFNRRVQGARTQENYEKNIKKVGSFSTVQDFWDFYVHLVRPNDLPNTSDYHLFKDGIKPMWEDGANRLGGKWIVRLPKGLASRYWEDLILGVIGEQFEVGDEICGAVISIRYQEDIISLWTRNATDIEVRNKILETMKRLLPLDDPRITVQYKNHDASIRDNSSFRNTEPIPLGPTYMGRRGSGRFDREGGER
jgi:translation initiation factor 4E